MSKLKKRHYLLTFLPLGCSIIFLCALLYLSMQQNIRLSQNEQLAQIAEDLALRLSQQPILPQNFPANKVNIEKSLAPFIIVYDKNKNLFGTTGIIDGKNPDLPLGVLDNSLKKENRISWEPKNGIREAIVVVHFKDKSEGYV